MGWGIMIRMMLVLLISVQGFRVSCLGLGGFGVQGFLGIEPHLRPRVAM